MARWAGSLGILRPRVVGADHRAGFKAAERALAGLRPHCPTCGTGRLERVAGSPSLRACSNQECGATVSLDALSGAALELGIDRAEAAAQHRREATHLIYGAQSGTIAASLWAAYSGSWATLAGGAGIAAVLLALAVVARYRAWQVEHVRMFELQAPFRDFVQNEIGTLFRRGAGAS